MESHLSPPNLVRERGLKQWAATANCCWWKTKKINNCIAKLVKKFLFLIKIKTSTKRQKIFIERKSKANLVNKAKNVKSNFKALVLQERISRVKRNRIFWVKTSRRREDQATKGLRRMPWYMAPKKDVTSCEKLRGGANIQRSADIRMRELSTRRVCYHYMNR